MPPFFKGESCASDWALTEWRERASIRATPCQGNLRACQYLKVAEGLRLEGLLYVLAAARRELLRTSRRPPCSQQWLCDGLENRVRAVAAVELDQQVRDVVLHSAFGQVQAASDLL